MPLEIADLVLPVVAPDKNAAPIYRQIDSLFHNKFAKQQKLVDKSLRRMATPEQKADADEAIVQMQPIFDLTQKLASHPDCDFGRDFSKGTALMFPELASMKGLMRDLAWRADWQDRKGNWREALRTMEVLGRVEVDSGSDPILIGLMVRISGHTIAARQFERMIGRHQRDVAFLAAAQSLISSKASIPDIREYLRGEIVLVRIGLKNANSSKEMTGAAGPADEFEKGLFQIKFIKDVLDEKFIQAWRVGWSNFPKDPADWQGYGAALKKMEDFVEKDRSPANGMNRILFPAYSYSMDAVGTMQATDRLLLTSIGLLQAQISTGQLPGTLAESFGDTRLDPFDSKPLRYKPQGNGFMLYSIGRDRTDDGGHRRQPGENYKVHADEVVEFH